ncbi:MAG: CMP-N-acetlyneuraminic acid synthetase [Candidatus Wallbacteria bacterium HGW-Wallbacteria-1]|uniref:CMP-N-acetlyneuraminic acid synthetase n=1 Tax=Candidatus Wallbacteria bacterium HGW-Wallbacteria-1 TaxID=2013854 RepID=A0A2N1PP55_9BACT|nr:MAG: CMP-N-acetlyneuraminic acid synthetase [Candidatus Wallbacteria bacterium HGW-Wallbacteria-1]
MERRVLAVIPARAGSKRLPGKNSIDLCGKPLIVWTIEAALASGYIDRVIVSTDDSVIADISRKAGAEVPFMRPAELASDTAGSAEVVIHALEFAEAEEGLGYDFVTLLQPTSPLRTVEDIDSAIEKICETDCDGVISVCKCDHPPQWSFELGSDGDISSLGSLAAFNSRSQDLTPMYRINGAIYIVRSDLLGIYKTFFVSRNLQSFVMHSARSVDIDEMTDLHIASAIMKSNL